MANARFTAVLEDGHKGVAFEVPFDPAERWGTKPEPVGPRRRGHRVLGKVNGVAFKSAVVPRSRSFWVLIDDDVRAQAKLKPGTTAKIELRPAAPTVTGDPDIALARLRSICLALPDTEEKVAWGEPTFRVHGRLFAMFANNHHHDGRIAVWCNAPDGAQQDLVAADPKNLFIPPYVGAGGWIGIRLDTRLSRNALTALLEQAWRTTAEARRVSKRRRR